VRYVQQAFRALLRAPLVNLVAIASLALGIGATTAIFSQFDQMLLRSLPVLARVLGGDGPQAPFPLVPRDAVLAKLDARS